MELVSCVVAAAVAASPVEVAAAWPIRGFLGDDVGVGL